MQNILVKVVLFGFHSILHSSCTVEMLDSLSNCQMYPNHKREK